MGLFNATCPLPVSEIEAASIPEKPIFGDITFQTLQFYISLGFTAIVIATFLYSSISHLCCYVRPREQRQIIRILFYNVVVAVVSTFSIFNYKAYPYLWPVEGLYEPISLGAIFFLFVEFAAPDPETREEYFNSLDNQRQKGGRFQLKKAWTFVPGGSLRWYQSKYVALYLYFIATIVIKIVEEITQATNTYCQYSFSPAFAHFWVTIISNVALPVGVVAIVQFYVRMNKEPHFKARHATSKILSFKAIILVNFVQEIIFDILVSNQAFKNTETLRISDFSIGLQSLLLCLEQASVSIWFLWSFSVKEYREIHRQFPGDRKMSPFRGALNALNASDIFAGAFYAVKLLFAGVGPKGNGNWRSNPSAFEPMKAPSSVQLHGVASYQGSASSSMMADVEGSNRYGQQGYEMGLHPRTAEYPPQQEAPGYDYNPPAYPPPERSRSPSPNDYDRGAYPYRGHRHAESADETEHMMQVPASSLGRPQDRDQYH
ncbi:organic solute transporter Ostalpha-domain-containing protein [Xylariaceae sp. FL0255]|nr:organic solute transporter Ostalpha-domain-containing protein [Xylariaceae sp. FL0255]